MSLVARLNELTELCRFFYLENIYKKNYAKRFHSLKLSLWYHRPYLLLLAVRFHLPWHGYNDVDLLDIALELLNNGKKWFQSNRCYGHFIRSKCIDPILSVFFASRVNHRSVAMKWNDWFFSPRVSPYPGIISTICSHISAIFLIFLEEIIILPPKKGGVCS